MGSYYSSALCCCCVNGADAHHQLSQEHLDQLTHAFDYYDTDGSGHIGKDELAAALRSMGQSPMQSEVEHMVKEVDMDGNGEIELAEFIDLMTREWEDVDPEQELTEMFKVLDRGRVGYISIRQLMCFLKKTLDIATMTADEMDRIERLCQAADHDHDGRISCAEFIVAVIPRGHRTSHTSAAQASKLLAVPSNTATLLQLRVKDPAQVDNQEDAVDPTAAQPSNSEPDQASPIHQITEVRSYDSPRRLEALETKPSG